MVEVLFLFYFFNHNIPQVIFKGKEKKKREEEKKGKEMCRDKMSTGASPALYSLYMKH